MREILFRGRQRYVGKWVKGCLHVIESNTLIFAWILGPSNHESIEVSPATVGQYTGRADRNGVKIFEGDIVKTWLEGGAHSGFSWPLGVVEFRESAFGLAHGKYKFTPFSSYAPRVLMEVVGNIHDNPELLKEDE